MISTQSSDTESMTWHRWLAHINMRDLADVHKHADGVPKFGKSTEICRARKLGKAHKLPFLGKFKRATRIGEVVHSDIVGKLTPSFPDGYRYVCTFLDDYSRHTYISMFRRRSELPSAFGTIAEEFRKLMMDRNMKWTSRPISILHSDGAKRVQVPRLQLWGGRTKRC